MFNAVLAERASPSEGIWIDQLCINQDDEEEKMTTIGFMDVIYKNARLVVILLEDVILSKTECNVLQCLLNKSERGANWDLKVEGELKHHAICLLWKIFSARWFTRAWCDHEFRVSLNYVFLVGVESPPSGFPTVLRFTPAFLKDLRDINAC
jgi:Heterokaryon incompatibility protein (HET)